MGVGLLQQRFPVFLPQDEIKSAVSQQMLAMMRSDRKIAILEAGCGRKWDVDLRRDGYTLTGVDLDQEALRLRVECQKDLDIAVVGDIRNVEFPPDSFDVIYSCFVLEHVSGVEGVLRRFAQWLRPGGKAIIRIPDPESVHGFFSRVTPFWIHVAYYKMMGVPNAGKPGYNPYPVFYDDVLFRAHFESFCASLGLRLELVCGTPAWFRFGTLVRGFKRVVSLLSGNRLSHRHDNLLYVLSKEG